jgi:Flp pilus assembly protein TadG
MRAAALVRGREAGAVRRSTRAERGQGTAELAMMLPLMLVLLIGIIEVANGFNAYTSVVNATRDGARLGSKGAATDAQIQALVVRDLARLKNTTPTSAVTVTHATVSGTNSVKVQACYPHTTLLHVPLVMPNSMSLCASPTMPTLN